MVPIVSSRGESTTSCRRAGMFAAWMACVGVASAGLGASQVPSPSPPAAPGTPPSSQTQAAPSREAAQPQPGEAASEAQRGRVFGSDAGIIFNQVKPDKTADFERVIARLREALERSSNPVRRQQAAGWRVFRSVEPGPNGSVLYLFWVNPAVKGEDYTVSKILAEAFPQEAQELYTAYAGAYAAGQNLLNLELVAALGTPASTPAAAGAAPVGLREIR